MSMLGRFMRKTETGHAIWCPGCGRMHVIPNRWGFDGNIEAPTFVPSVKIEYNGQDAGVFDAAVGLAFQRAPAKCCHFFLRAGVLEYCPDSTHKLAGQNIILPEIPLELRT